MALAYHPSEFYTPPSTRYQGSKRRIIPWLHRNLSPLRFETVLDGFGGTGSVSYLLKAMGKKVTFNDIMQANLQSGIALIENSSDTLSADDIKFLMHRNGFEYRDFIEKTFDNYYFLKTENQWLDTVCRNIEMLSEIYEGSELRFKRAVAYHCLFQACLSKRPFNLFHRRNLNLRTAQVHRTFGNKNTWEKDFSSLFKMFHVELETKIFSNGKENRAVCKDIFSVANDYDLVYLDPPYIEGRNRKNQYSQNYHFLEGLAQYDKWGSLIDWSSVLRATIDAPTRWRDGEEEKNFDRVFKKFKDSMIVLSYGSPGMPPLSILKVLLSQYKRNVVLRRHSYNYALRKSKNRLYEILLIGT